MTDNENGPAAVAEPRRSWRQRAREFFRLPAVAEQVTEPTETPAAQGAQSTVRIENVTGPAQDELRRAMRSRSRVTPRYVPGADQDQSEGHVDRAPMTPQHHQLRAAEIRASDAQRHAARAARDVGRARKELTRAVRRGRDTRDESHANAINELVEAQQLQLSAIHAEYTAEAMYRSCQADRATADAAVRVARRRVLDGGDS